MKWEVIFIYFFKYPVFMGIIFSWKFPIYFLVLPISTCKKKKKKFSLYNSKMFRLSISDKELISCETNQALKKNLQQNQRTIKSES